MKPHSIMSWFFLKSSAIPNLLSLSALLLSLLAIFHLSYPHLLFQLNSLPTAPPLPPPPPPISPSPSPSPSPSSPSANATAAHNGWEVCGGDLFRGEWVWDAATGPYYYDNRSCSMIQDHQNCFRHGRPDAEFLRWRWRPASCSQPLPRFDPARFLELVRGKAMAFVGDSLARNHMQSLLCLLSKVAYPEDASVARDENQRYFYAAHNFTISIFWSPFLVRAEQAAAGENLFHVFLDEPDWVASVAAFDYLIVSSGTWFTRPSIYHKSRQRIACNYCSSSFNLPALSLIAANRAAFRSAFGALDALPGGGFAGEMFLRTLSPSHFEGGSWDQGGSCGRTRPVGPREARFEAAVEKEMYRAQVEEFERAAAARGGRKMRLLDTTAAMLMRPDGHPDVYGHPPDMKQLVLPHDCVHWCLPGPVDTWNELLLHTLTARSREADSRA